MAAVHRATSLARVRPLWSQLWHASRKTYGWRSWHHVARWLYIVQCFHELGQTLVRSFSCSITINADDELYDHVQWWLSKARHITTSRDRVAYLSTFYNARVPDNEIWYTQNAGVQILRHGATIVWVSFTFDHRSTHQAHLATAITLRCLGWHSFRRLRELLERMRDEWQQCVGTTVSVYRPTAHGSSWTSPYDIPKIDIRHLAFDGHASQDLIHDVELYFRSETAAECRRRSQPHRRGYLLYGPPGTGKTSMVRAIASKFDLRIYVIDLAGSGMDNDTLRRLYERVPPRSIILIEDIDCAGIGRASDPVSASQATPHTTASSVTLSGLLNAIDGLTSPQGHILIMTSNAPTTLDTALLRPGRVDKQIRFENIGSAGAMQLFLQRYRSTESDDHSLLEQARQFAHHFSRAQISPATLQAHLAVTDKASIAVAASEMWARVECAAIDGT